MVFVAFLQGDSTYNKVKRICDVVGANIYEYDASQVFNEIQVRLAAAAAAAAAAALSLSLCAFNILAVQMWAVCNQNGPYHLGLQQTRTIFERMALIVSGFRASRAIAGGEELSARAREDREQLAVRGPRRPERCELQLRGLVHHGACVPLHPAS